MDAKSHVWRPPLPERVLGAMLIPAFLGIAGVAAQDNWELASFSNLMTFLGCVGIAILAGLYAAATSLTLTADLLVVRNLGHRREIPLCEVTAIRSGYYGTEILCRKGKWWFGFAVQKSRLATWMGKKTRADHMAEVVMSAARERRGD